MTDPAGAHPAPWPLLTLDVAELNAAGHEPVPFRQFILKVHSRCNLSCSYCYVYEMADQGWRQMPNRMSEQTAAAAIDRIAVHAGQHNLPDLDVILHGGEPLLVGARWLTELVTELRARVPAPVNVGVQTNGTLLDAKMLDVLRELQVQVGVSLDGDAEATGRYRRYANGRNSFDAVARGLSLLNSADFHECYGGLLCTVDVGNDPVATYETLLEFNPPAIDFLLPHANWSCPPLGSGYADWLIEVFERWYSAPRQETTIRLFSELIQLVLGQSGGVEGIGLRPSALIVIDTDGAIKQLDSLSSAYPGAADTGLHVMSDSLDKALTHPTTVARQIGAAALSRQCQTCPVMDVCGGGQYPHRYREGEGFLNPSVYCADLLRLITHVRDRVDADIRRLAAVLVDQRFDLGGEADSLRGGASLGVLVGEGFRITVEHVGPQSVGRSVIAGRSLVDGEVSGRHKGVRVIFSMDGAAASEKVVAELNRLAQSSACRQVARVVNARGQCARMLGAVDGEEHGSCPLIVRQRLLRPRVRAEHGRQANQHRRE
jgi:uncharacterized protein